MQPSLETSPASTSASATVADDASAEGPPSPEWHVYVLVSSSARRTYVGITTEPGRRLDEHNGERRRGAQATRAGRPWELAIVYGPYATRGEALSAELRVKKLRGTDRLSSLEPLSPGTEA